MRVIRGIAAVAVTCAGWMALGGAAASAAGTGASISTVEGQALTDIVVDSFSSCTVGSRTGITIDWGDGTPASTGTLVNGLNGSCTITGSHTYAEEGSYATAVTYTSGGITPVRVTDHGSAAVADAPVAASAVSDFNVQAGSALNGVVAHWSDPAPEALSSYSSTIDWGDGTSSTGTIGQGTVTGSHTYANGGRFTITVTFHDEGGASATAQEHAVVTGCSTAAASTPAPAFTPSSSDPNARYVQALYHDILGRSPAASELAAATGALSLGATRSQLALTLLDSAEYRGRLVAADYNAYLHRAPSAGETSAFVAFLGSHADEAVIGQILGSAEYFAGRGHSSNDGFLTAMYCDALDRSIDQLAQSTDDNALGSGAPRTTLASAVLGSTERRSLLVRGYYLHYLRRAAGAGELATWIALMKSGGTDEQVIAAIVSSSEYYSQFTPSLTIPIVLILKGNTLRTTLTHDASVTLSVFRILPRSHASASAVRVARPRTRLVGTVDFGFHHKGHVTLQWNLKVDNRKLGRGRYLLVLRAFRGHKPYHKPYRTRSLIGLSDSVRLTIR